MRSQIERYMSARTCQPCGGKRLRPEALAVRVCGLGIMDVCSKNIGKAMEWVREIDPDLVSDRVSDNDGGEHKKQVLTEREKTIANQVLKEIDGRLKFLDGIGLDYITMDRTAPHPLGRRGPARAAGHPDRVGADRGAVRLRRAHGLGCIPTTTSG